jgi:hypothetical protein
MPSSSSTSSFSSPSSASSSSSPSSSPSTIGARASNPPQAHFLFTFAISALGAFLCTIFLAAFSALFLCSCGLAGEAPGGTLDEDDARSAPSNATLRPAPLRELEAAVDGLGLRISPAVQLERGAEGVVWRVDGRATVDLAAVASWVPDDAYGRAELTGSRTFSITLRDASEQNTMASGLPLFVTVTPRQGDPVEAAIWFRPRLERAIGSARIFHYSTIHPVWVAQATDGAHHGTIEYRGKVALGPEWRLEPADGVGGPALTALGNGRWRLGWSFDALAADLHREPPRFALRARRGGVLVTRVAELQMRAVRLDLTRRDPRLEWPAGCEPAVRTCLAALPALDADTEPCGSYRQVQACGGPAGAREPLEAGGE